jgi:hypothetical protein
MKDAVPRMARQGEDRTRCSGNSRRILVMHVAPFLMEPTSPICELLQQNGLSIRYSGSS